MIFMLSVFCRLLEKSELKIEASAGIVTKYSYSIVIMCVHMTLNYSTVIQAPRLKQVTQNPRLLWETWLVLKHCQFAVFSFFIIQL